MNITREEALERIQEMLEVAEDYELEDVLIILANRDNLCDYRVVTE